MTVDEYRRMARDGGYEPPVEKSFAPGLVRDPHEHEFSLIVFVSEGDFILDVVGEGGVRTTTYKPGETVEVAAEVTHAERAGDNSVRFLVACK